MKKILLAVSLTTIAFFGFNNLQAQDITFGAKAGPSYSILTMSEGDDFPEGWEVGDSQRGIGFHLGVYAAMPMGEKSEILLEALFQARNVKYDLTTVDISGNMSEIEITNTYNYLSIPLMYGYLFNDHFHMHIGPEFNLFLGGKSKSDGDDVLSGDDFNDSVSPFELAVGIGAVYNLDMGLNFGLRYSRGLTDMGEDVESVGDIFNVNSNVIELSIGYNIVKF